MGASIDIVHQGWLNSSGHRANMVDTGVNAVRRGRGLGQRQHLHRAGLRQTGDGHPDDDDDQAADDHHHKGADDDHDEAADDHHDEAADDDAAPEPGPGRAQRTLAGQRRACCGRRPPRRRPGMPTPTAPPGRCSSPFSTRPGKVVRQVWSPVVCSGCRAAVSFAALPDGFYGLVTAAYDGRATSAVSPTWAFTVDRTVPLAPSGLTRVGGRPPPSTATPTAPPAGCGCTWSTPTTS